MLYIFLAGCNSLCKARSSAKHKERLLKFQELAGQKSQLMLLMDMKVCWSSTFKMLKCALALKEVSISLLITPFANI